MWKLSKRYLLSLLGAASVLTALAVQAERIDPSQPQQFRVGAPPGAAAMDRIDSRRSGITKDDLPTQPKLAWRARINGIVDLPLAVASDGAVVVSASGGLFELDPKGKQRWFVKTGSATPVTGPVLLSDGTRVVLSSAGELHGVVADGSHRFITKLGDTTQSASEPLPRPDGGVAIGVERRLLLFGASGQLRSRSELPDVVAQLLSNGGRIYVIASNGDVYAWDTLSAPQKLASFGGPISGSATLLGERRMWAVVDHQKLIELELGSGLRHERLSDAAFTLAGSPIILSNQTRVVSGDGVLLGHDRSGNETLRVALEPSLNFGDAGITAGQDTSPAPIMDAKGTLCFARPGIEFGCVVKSGRVVSAAGSGCADPVSVVPAGPRRVAVACRTGLVFVVGQ